MQSANQVKKALGIESEHTYSEYNQSEELKRYEAEQIEKHNNAKGVLAEYDCPICHNKGYTLVQDSETGNPLARPCECKKIRDSRKAAKKSGAWELMQRHTFDNFKTKEEWQKELKQKAMLYCQQEEKRWLYAGGQTGAGKTHLCTAVFNSFFNSPVNGVYCMWRSEIRKLLGSGFAGFDETEERIETLKTCDVLYIDDLFKTDDNARPERREIELAFEILNSRYNTQKPTIISSEKTLKEIAGLNEAIAGRIVEQCKCFILSVENNPAKNYRLGEI